MKKPWLIVTATGVVALSTLAFVMQTRGGGDAGASAAPQEGAAAAPTVQPIAFPHNTHAGQFNIDCQYCHFSAERSVDAGIPSVEACMGCHTVLPGRNKPEEVQKLREYWERGEPIPWVRIYKTPDYVRFPHMRHVAKDAGNLDCTECHGDVKQIEVIEEVNQPLTMGWCVEGHRQKEASLDCTSCHY